MQPNDTVCRSAAYPKFVRSEVFDEEQLFNFTSDKDQKVYACSVASRFLLRTDDGVHAYGRAYAHGVNARNAEKLGHHASPSQLCVYLGFYSLRYRTVISVQMTFYRVFVKWRPEKECDAHFQIEFVQLSKDGTKANRRNDRSAAINQLFAGSIGPVVCPVAARDETLSEYFELLPMHEEIDPLTA